MVSSWQNCSRETLDPRRAALGSKVWHRDGTEFIICVLFHGP